MRKKKKDGKIFTPKDVVEHMLGLLEYDKEWGAWPNLKGWAGLRKHIIDNSCGDGAFLTTIVDTYCQEVKASTRPDIGYTDETLKHDLETYIHGIELDPVEYGKCLENLDKVAEKYGITDVKWDIQNRDALSCRDYDGKMDFVVANPPYIRTHDLECDLTGYSFTEEGMKDLYLAFYELGFRMLKETGSMCYIAPSSWFTSIAGQKMRDYIMDTRCLYNVCDFGHKQVFENATTYVAICVFRKFKNELIKRQYVWYRNTQNPDTKDGAVVTYDDMCIDGKFYFGTPDQLKRMHEIIEYGKSLKRKDKAFEVKNGFATLADDVFIQEDKGQTFRIYHKLRPWNVIPVIKSSTGKQAWCYYPYGKDGKLMSESQVDEIVINTLAEHKEKLEARATTEPWYAFGRTQAINDTYKDKWAIKSIVKTTDDCHPVLAPSGTGVYGGLYILPNTVEGDVENYLIGVLKSQDFLDYVKMLGKYKSGGYYTYSSKDLENYLNWNYKTLKETIKAPLQ